jgi:hypothetical protein
LPEQLLSGPSPAELVTIFYCLIWDSPNLEGQVPVFISPGNRVAQLYPRALGVNLEREVPVFIYPRNRVAQLYPQALGSLYVAPCGGILSRY